jgi:hypothetical protein
MRCITPADPQGMIWQRAFFGAPFGFAASGCGFVVSRKQTGRRMSPPRQRITPRKFRPFPIALQTNKRFAAANGLIWRVLPEMPCFCLKNRQETVCARPQDWPGTANGAAKG